MNLYGLHIDFNYYPMKTKKEWSLTIWHKIKYKRPKKLSMTEPQKGITDQPIKIVGENR